MSWVCESCGTEVPGGQAHICRTPYRGYEYKNPPQPPYDTLVVGPSGNRAFRGGVEVDEKTGRPLHPQVIEAGVRGRPPVSSPPIKRRPGRPRKVISEQAKAR